MDQSIGVSVNQLTSKSTDSAAGKPRQIGGVAVAAARIRSSGLVRGDGRAAEVMAFEDAVVSFFIDAADMLGVPKSVAAIYGICFASPEPLSFSDINDRLDISSGSISQGLRVLKEVGALRVAHPNAQRSTLNAQPSSTLPQVPEINASGGDETEVKQALSRSRERFEPDLELRKLVLHWIEQRLQKQLGTGRDNLTAIIAAIPRSTPAVSEVLDLRFDSLKTWHDKAHSLLPLAKTFLKLT